MLRIFIMIVIACLAALCGVAWAGPVCGPWEPSSNPYRGDQAEAVMRLTEIPEDERRTLADMVRQQYGSVRELVYVSRDGIVGGGDLANLRHMNFGDGRICQGPVNRSTWPAGRREVARVFTVGRWAVLVFDSCRNVALADQGAALPQPAQHGPGDVRSGGVALWPPLVDLFRTLPEDILAVPEPSGLLLVLGALGAMGLVHLVRPAAGRRGRRGGRGGRG